MHYITTLYYVTTIGRVLNRFSKDIGFMDDLLPFQFVELFSVSKLIEVASVIVVHCCLVIVEVYGHCSSGMRGKLLALHSCRGYHWSAAAVSLVLPTNLKAH